MSFKGIDVSKCNGSVDMNRVAKSGVKFVILRAGYGDLISQMDTQFTNNIKNAIANNLSIGIYYFSYATSNSDAQSEADICAKIIAPYKAKINMFVAYDFEYDSASYYQRQTGRSVTPSQVDSFAIAFCERIKSYGYKPAIYFNKDYQNNMFNASTLNRYIKWLAYYSGNQNGCDIQQTSSTGHIDGISGNVDTDILYNTSFISSTSTYFKSDTNGTMNLQIGNTYQIKLTSDGKPSFGCGDALTGKFVKQNGQDYLFTIHADKKGITGVYANGKKFLVCNTDNFPIKSDTPSTLTLGLGKTYQFAFTCNVRPNIAVANNSVSLTYNGNKGNKYYYKVCGKYATGGVGLYGNGQRLCVITVK